MSQELLLEVQQTVRPKSGNYCGRCFHAIRPHHYRPDWIYCKKRPSKRTQYGILKVKARREACEMFEQTPPHAAGEGTDK